MEIVWPFFKKNIKLKNCKVRKKRKMHCHNGVTGRHGPPALKRVAVVKDTVTEREIMVWAPTFLFRIMNLRDVT